MPRIAIHPSVAIADLLRRRRKELGLSLREVEERTGHAGHLIPFSTLSRVEQGKIDPGVHRFHVLLRLYDLPPQLAGDLLELESLAGDIPTEGDVKTLHAEGLRYWKDGNVRQALAYFFAVRQSVSKGKAGVLPRQKALMSFAVVARSLGKYYIARQIVEELLLDHPEREILVSVLIEAAHCWQWLGAPEVALAFAARAEVHLASATPQQRAWLFHEKASLFVDLKDFSGGEAALARSLQEYTKAKDLYGLGKALLTRDRLFLEQNRIDAALEAARLAVEHARRHGFVRLRLQAQLDEARALMLARDRASALAGLTRTLGEAVSLDDPMMQFFTHYYLWRVHAESGDPSRAALHLHSAKYFVGFLDQETSEAAEIRALRFPQGRRPGRPRRQVPDLP